MMKAEYIIMQGTMRLRHCTLLDFSIFTVFFQACIFDNFLEEQSSAGTLQDFICFLLFQLPLVKTMKNCCMYFYVFESTVNEEKKNEKALRLKTTYYAAWIVNDVLVDPYLFCLGRYIPFYCSKKGLDQPKEKRVWINQDIIDSPHSTLYVTKIAARVSYSCLFLNF